jgi:hypothetical protein
MSESTAARYKSKKLLLSVGVIVVLMETMGIHHPRWQVLRKPIAHKKFIFIHNK